MVRHAALCSGYDGIGLGLGLDPTWVCELDPDASRITEAHYPGVPNHGDIKTADWATFDPIDLLTAGYPCQPFSHAGRRLGVDDERHLWPFVAQAIRVLRPRNVLLENVAGHLSLGFGTVLGDLAEIGYDARWVCFPASDVGAPHKRARVFIYAQPRSASAAPDPGGLRWVGREGLQDCWGDPSQWGQAVDLIGDTNQSSAPNPSGPGAGWHPRGAPGTQESSGWRQPDQGDPSESVSAAVDWGIYEPAIRRWERIIARTAPPPTIGPGRGRMSPRFREWMMGLPDGWVSSLAISWKAQITATGNGVVPLHVRVATRLLLLGTEIVERERARQPSADTHDQRHQRTGPAWDGRNGPEDVYLPTPQASDWKGPNNSGSGTNSAHGLATIVQHLR